jgi:hypothetical protein
VQEPKILFDVRTVALVATQQPAVVRGERGTKY